MDNLRLQKVKQFSQVALRCFHTIAITCTSVGKQQQKQTPGWLLLMEGSVPEWLQKNKDQTRITQIHWAYMSGFPRWLTIFYSTWDWKQQGKRENEVTHLLFIGYQPPHSAAFQLRWILNVIFFLQLHTEKLLSEKEITEFNNISCDAVICLVTVLATFATYSSGLIDHKYKCSHIFFLLHRF